MGYWWIQTYTLVTEPGTSLRAAGWRDCGQVRRDGKGWNNRPKRKTEQPQTPKRLWIKPLALSWDEITKRVGVLSSSQLSQVGGTS